MVAARRAGATGGLLAHQRDRRRPTGDIRAAGGACRAVGGVGMQPGGRRARRRRNRRGARCRRALAAAGRRISSVAAGCRSGRGGRAAWPRSGSPPGACGTSLKNSTDSSRLPRSMARSSFIAGPRALLDQFIAEVGREQADAVRNCGAHYAFHSHQMDAFTGELGDSLRGLRSQAVAVPMFSSVTGETLVARGSTPTTGAATCANPCCSSGRSTKRSMPASTRPRARRPSVADHPDWRPSPDTIAKELRFGTLIASAPINSIVSAVASLHVHGVPIDWGAIIRGAGRMRGLPGHPWEKQVHSANRRRAARRASRARCIRCSGTSRSTSRFGSPRSTRTLRAIFKTTASTAQPCFRQPVMSS